VFKKVKQPQNKLNRFVLVLFMFTIILISGCTKEIVNENNISNNTDSAEIQIPVIDKIPVEVESTNSCLMENPNIACSKFSITNNKISVTFVNTNVGKLSVVDFRVKSDNTDVFCTGTYTVKTFVNANSGGEFTLVCGGIPTGRLESGARTNIYFEIDYKTSSNNSFQTATGTIDTRVN